MFTVHVISDLFLKFNEFTPKTETNLPDVDLVILNGNISTNGKRAMLYVEELCAKYPSTQFVYNYGMSEAYPIGCVPKAHYCNDGRSEWINAIETRARVNETWPKNLTFLYRNNKQIQLKNEKVDILCAFGFPRIVKYTGQWEDTIWYKNIIMDVTNDYHDTRLALPKDTSYVCHGEMPIWATQEYINKCNQQEFDIIRKWELSYNGTSGKKILVTHINPIKDTRCANQIVDFYNIHLSNGLWIGSNTPINNTTYLGAKFHSNPGRGEKARSLVLTIN